MQCDTSPDVYQRSPGAIDTSTLPRRVLLLSDLPQKSATLVEFQQGLERAGAEVTVESLTRYERNRGTFDRRKHDSVVIMVDVGGHSLVNNIRRRARRAHMDCRLVKRQKAQAQQTLTQFQFQLPHPERFMPASISAGETMVEVDIRAEENPKNLRVDNDKYLRPFSLLGPAARLLVDGTTSETVPDASQDPPVPPDVSAVHVATNHDAVPESVSPKVEDHSTTEQPHMTTDQGSTTDQGPKALFKDALREVRVDLGLLQSQLARLVPRYPGASDSETVTQTTVSRWERGDRIAEFHYKYLLDLFKDPRLSNAEVPAFMIAEVLGPPSGGVQESPSIPTTALTLPMSEKLSPAHQEFVRHLPKKPPGTRVEEDSQPASAMPAPPAAPDEEVSLATVRRKAALLDIGEVVPIVAVKVGAQTFENSKAANDWLDEQLWKRYDAIRKELFPENAT